MNEKSAMEPIMFETSSPEPAPSAAPRIARLGDLLAEWEADAIAATAARETGRARGPVTGLAALDRDIGGALAPGVHGVHAVPGIGKSAFALQVAGSCGCPALYLSCEMARLELFRRHVARTTSTYLGRLKTGELPPAESVALAQRGAAAAPLLVLADATQAPASSAWLRQVAEAVRGGAEHLLIVVDSIHSWTASISEGAPEYDALNAGLDSVRTIAGSLACAVLVIAERNRARMEAGGLHAGAGSRRIEYGCETLLELNRDDKATPDGNGEVEVFVTAAKNRNGPPGRKIPLRFHGALQRFREP